MSLMLGLFQGIEVEFRHQCLWLILVRDQLNGLNEDDLSYVAALLAPIYLGWDKVAHEETMAQLSHAIRFQ